MTQARPLFTGLRESLPPITPELRYGHDRKGEARARARAASFLKSARQAVMPVVHNVRDQTFAVMGFGCIDAAAFVHSLFTGLIVTGASFLIFEWKVSS